MKKIIQWLTVMLDDIVGVSEPNSNQRCINAGDAQEKFDAGLISLREYQEVLKRTRG
jgi:hypothetical protein